VVATAEVTAHGFGRAVFEQYAVAVAVEGVADRRFDTDTRRAASHDEAFHSIAVEELVAPDRCIEIAERYRAAGCDLLLRLVNLYKMQHEKVVRSIELLGERVIPQFG
jgi:hypothetical protein